MTALTGWSDNSCGWHWEMTAGSNIWVARNETSAYTGSKPLGLTTLVHGGTDVAVGVGGMARVQVILRSAKRCHLFILGLMFLSSRSWSPRI